MKSALDKQLEKYEGKVRLVRQMAIIGGLASFIVFSLIGAMVVGMVIGSFW